MSARLEKWMLREKDTRNVEVVEEPREGSYEVIEADSLNFHMLKVTYMYIQKCIHNYTYTFTYVYTYTYTYIHIHIYIYIYTYTYIHVYLHACMHACIHTYMDTWSLGRKMRTEACLMRREKRRRKQQQQVVNKNRKAGPAKGSKCQKMSTVTSLWVKNIAMVVISCVFLAV